MDNNCNEDVKRIERNIYERDVSKGDNYCKIEKDKVQLPLPLSPIQGCVAFLKAVLVIQGEGRGEEGLCFDTIADLAIHELE